MKTVSKVMENPICFFALYSILILKSITLCMGARAPLLNSTTDKQALVYFKNSVEDDAILSTNWSESTSVCDWVGVTCGTKHHRVTSLNLSGYDLTGTVAQHLGNLTFLRYLDISSNNFSGSLPFQLSRLRRLKGMSVGENSLTGEIPAWLGSLPQLEILYLYNNSFSGTIPVSMFNNSKLQVLFINGNLVEGSIPKEIGNISSLLQLNLNYNYLSGPIPHAIFNVSSLRKIGIANNSLSGSLPTDMCDNLPNIEVLDLSVNQLYGEVPANIWKCRHLEDMVLSVNKFHGKIPSEIGRLSMLRWLYLGENKFQGGVPAEIGNLTRLEILAIQSASLTGTIPSSIFNMPSLTFLSLTGNSLSGQLPRDMCSNVSSIKTIYLYQNQLQGQIPPNIWKCTHLEDLQMPINNFSGKIPSEIGRLSKLIRLTLGVNNFQGGVPAEIGNLSRLDTLDIQRASLSGNIPSSIFNLSSLTYLNLAENSLSGSLPSDMGHSLPKLENLFLSDNYLSGEKSSTQELIFFSSLTNCRHLKYLIVSHNSLNGVLPTSIGNFSSSLQCIWASHNNIMGVIPSGIGNLSSLLEIELGVNQLSGPIPPTIGNTKKLQRMYLYENQLVGYIPKDVCQMSNLGELIVFGNMLEGPMPKCLGDMKSLKEIHLGSNQLNSTIPSNFWTLTNILALNLSSNYLKGQLSSQLGNLKAIYMLDLSFNQFSGNIPSIDGCQSLESLNLSNNLLEGSIPQSLGNVRALIELDLSHNNLSGSIPKSLEHLPFLEYFNVSHNNLVGEIPNGGRFGNFNAQSFSDNLALCSPIRFEVPSCQENHHKSRSLMKFMVPSVILVVSMMIGMLVFIKKRKPKKSPLPTEVSPMIEYRRLSYIELERGTRCFSESNLIGKGSFGSVFEATLTDGLKVAVKVFNLDLQGAERSFDTETEILGSIRHRNIVRVIGCCSNPEFKALVLTYMSNGNLDKWLYSNMFCLNLIQRLKIAMDVAAALEYLHHGHTFPVVHCDVKPSNVLLDQDMVAHLGDFGIGKLFDSGEAFIRTQTLGTIGYAAPELGMEGKVSTNGDVYSFGIMLLEIFTGKKPTNDMFGGEMKLKEWVSDALQENTVIEIIAPTLLSIEDQDFSAKEQYVVSIFELAMKCLAVSPHERINMIETTAALQRIYATMVTERRRPR